MIHTEVSISEILNIQPKVSRLLPLSQIYVSACTDFDYFYETIGTPLPCRMQSEPDFKDFFILANWHRYQYFFDFPSNFELIKSKNERKKSFWFQHHVIATRLCTVTVRSTVVWIQKHSRFLNCCKNWGFKWWVNQNKFK